MKEPTLSSIEDVQKLAALARLSIPEDDLPARAGEFDRIVAYIDQLNELTVTKTSTPALPALRNVFRADGEPTPPGTWTEKLVNLFPNRKGNHLEVKKIISHD